MTASSAHDAQPRDRNAQQIALLQQSTAAAGFRFVVLGDSGAAPSPTADVIFRELLSQAERRRPKPAFIVHLGDFAGPGDSDRHEHYLRQVGFRGNEREFLHLARALGVDLV